jgi:ribosome biogenesis GTPase
LVIRSQSGFYTVQTDRGIFTCRLRGRLKQGPREGDVIAVGDRVKLTPLDEDTGAIEEVEPRQRALVRMAPTPRGEYRQVILANLDLAVFMFACAMPEPRLGMLDRYLVIAEKQLIPPLILVNKIDLLDLEAARDIFNHYERVGYDLIYTSVKDNRGIDQVKSRLRGKLSVLTGPSGVGKSSLLNVMIPELDLHARKVSQATEKGRHTTVVREMYPLEGGGYVADTPGLKALALWDIEPEELDGYFPEIRSLVAECQFSDCTHVHEPGCAVMEAVAAGDIHPERYQSYLRMRFGEQA